MKKYFAAAAVAVMVFAFAAFAAQLDVDGGVLQAGVDGDLTCAETAEISYATPNTTDGDVNFYVSDFTATFYDEAGETTDGCDGFQAEFVVNDIEGIEGVNGIANTNNISVALVDGDSVTFSVDLNLDGAQWPLAEEIEEVSLLVTTPTGTDGYSDGFFGLNIP